MTQFGSTLLKWTLRERPVLVAAVVTLLVGVIDYVTGTGLRVFPLYFVPLGLIAGSQAQKHALGAALLLTAVWASINYDPLNMNVYLGNIASQCVAFVVVALLINAHKLRADMHQQLASTDALTGLLNSRAFFRAASRELAVQKRKGYDLTMAYLDVDNFKDVNTNLGHLGADDVLRDTALAMLASLRETDVIGRVGGDEFAIILPDTSAESARITLERLRKQVLAANKDRGMNITVSVGAVVFQRPASSVNEMLELSDQLMYFVKGETKDGVAIRPAQDLPPASTPPLSLEQLS